MQRMAPPGEADGAAASSGQPGGGGGPDLAPPQRRRLLRGERRQPKLDLMEFFDLGKTTSFTVPPLPKPILADPPEAGAEGHHSWEDAGRRSGRGQDGDEPFDDGKSYFDDMRRREEEILAGLSVGSGPLGMARSQVRTSAMSELDANTVMGSTVYGGSVSGKDARISSGRRAKVLEEILAISGGGARDPRALDRATSVVRLPIDRDEEAILGAIEANNVTVIHGHTGSGKTTRVPQFILDHYCRMKRDVNIIVTQPRRIAAKSVAQRVCQERSWRLGSFCGYKVGLDKSNVSPDTCILYCTTGVLKKMLIGKKNLNDWTHVIIDEVHEREEDMDFLILLCKLFLCTNSPGVKLVLMSATIDAQTFVSYFDNVSNKREGMRIKAGDITIRSEKTYEVSTFYLDDLEETLRVTRAEQKLGLGGRNVWPTEMKLEEPGLSDICVEIAMEITHRLNELDSELDEEAKRFMGVLVFLPGEHEIIRLKKAFDQHAAKFKLNWWTMPLYSRMPFEQMEQIFSRKLGVRKIILATNIAESSITIPDIGYVIDFCLTKRLYTDPSTNYSCLRLEWADKNSCEQRKGRCGRVQMGKVYRLVYEDFYSQLPDSTVPEMKRAPLDKVVLDAKMLEIGMTPKELLALAMDPPGLSNISSTIMALKEVGALLPTVSGKQVRDDGDITELGRIVASLPVDVRLGKLIVLSHQFDLLEEAVIIAAGLSNKSPFATPPEGKVFAFADKVYWSSGSFSDCVAVYLAYKTWHSRVLMSRNKTDQEDKRWCQHHHLQRKVLLEMKQAIEEISYSLREQGLEKFFTPNRPYRNQNTRARLTLMRYVVFGAFYPNYFVGNPGIRDLNMVERELEGCDPTTSVYFTNFPPDQSKMAHLLYTDQVREIFKGLVNPGAIKVQFSGSKVIVSFQRDPEAERREMGKGGEPDRKLEVLDPDHDGQLGHAVPIDEVIKPVYFAMKLRDGARDKGNRDLHIRVMDAVEAQKCAQGVMQRMETRSLMSEQGEGIVGNDPKDQFGGLKPVAFPEQHQPVEVLVVHVTSPGSFWVQLVNDEHPYDEISNEIVRVLSSPAPESPPVVSVREVRAGHLYLAPYLDDDHYRARVDKVSEEGLAMVFYVDFGNVGSVEWQKLRRIDTLPRSNCLKTSPGLALRCSLAFVKPNPVRSENRIWDKEASEVCRNLLSSEESRWMDVYSVVPDGSSGGSLITATLYEEAPEATMDFGCSLNHMLLNLVDAQGLNMAVRGEEGYLSKLEHSKRKARAVMSVVGTDWRGPGSASEASGSVLSATERRQRLMRDMDVSSLSGMSLDARNQMKGMTVKLQGPKHPLEFKLSSLQRAVSLSEVRVEQDSVNSVLINRFPGCAFDQWLAAWTVSAQKSRCYARSTSLMPCVPGIGALLALIFAPCVEMRCDPMLKRYTGCLLGLGPRFLNRGAADLEGGSSIETCPFYKEHDMEVEFDVEIDNRDLSLINVIRFKMGSMMARQSNGASKLSNREQAIECQDDLIGLFDKLLRQKQRKSVPKRAFGRANQWCQLPDRRFLVDTTLAGQEDFIYKPITQIKLVDPQQLANLTAYAEGRISSLKGMTAATGVAECPLCLNKKPFLNVPEVLEHLRSQTHKDKVKKYEALL